MALIQCPECGGNVSTAAAACPHCGYPISSNRKDNNDLFNANKNDAIYCVIFPKLIKNDDRVYIAAELMAKGIITKEERLNFLKHDSDKDYPFLIKSNIDKSIANEISVIASKYHATARLCTVSEYKKEYEIIENEITKPTSAVSQTNQIKESDVHSNPDDDIIRCPKCNSTAITTGARGVSWDYWSRRYS